MEIQFRIPVWDSMGLKISDRIFLIQFLASNHIKKFRICVNGRLTSKHINAFETMKSKKPIFLDAIREYIESGDRMDAPKKFLTEHRMGTLYSKHVIAMFKKNILESCETEQRRDNLEPYNLIFTI